NAEALDVVPQFGERGCRRGAGQSGADHDDVELPLVVRGDELQLIFAPRPLLVDGTVGNAGVEDARLLGHCAHGVVSRDGLGRRPVAEVKRWTNLRIRPTRYVTARLRPDRRSSTRSPGSWRNRPR